MKKRDTLKGGNMLLSVIFKCITNHRNTDFLLYHRCLLYIILVISHVEVCVCVFCAEYMEGA